MEIQWTNQIGARDREPWLLLVKGDAVVAFHGEDIPGLVVVRGTDSEKNGKWSCTTFRLQLAGGVRHIAGRDGWETSRFVEGLASTMGVKTPDTWAEVAHAMGISVPAAMDFLRGWRPKAAAKLDEVEQSLAALDAAAGDADAVTITVSFGSPTNRAIREGFWDAPKSIPGTTGEIRLISPSRGWKEGNIEIIGVSGTVLSVRHSAGMHGGYYAVQVAVVG